MARYLIKAPALLNGEYITASAQDPTEITYPDNQIPGLQWEPLDEPAQVALAKVGVKKQVLRPVAAPAKKPDSTPEKQTGKGKRAADQSPV